MDPGTGTGLAFRLGGLRTGTPFDCLRCGVPGLETGAARVPEAEFARDRTGESRLKSIKVALDNTLEGWKPSEGARGGREARPPLG